MQGWEAGADILTVGKFEFGGCLPATILSYLSTGKSINKHVGYCRLGRLNGFPEFEFVVVSALICCE